MWASLIGQSQPPPELIMKEFTSAGRIEALMEHTEGMDFILVQLDLKNDSLLFKQNSCILAIIQMKSEKIK